MKITNKFYLNYQYNAARVEAAYSLIYTAISKEVDDKQLEDHLANINSLKIILEVKLKIRG